MLSQRDFSDSTQILYHSVLGRDSEQQLTQRKQNYTSILLLSFFFKENDYKQEKAKNDEGVEY